MVQHAIFLAAALLLNALCAEPVTAVPASTAQESAVAEAAQHLARGDAGSALAVLKPLPDSVPVLLLRGAAKQELLQWDSALADFERALETDPRSADAYTARGHWYAIDGKDAKAVADFDRALAIDPGHRDALFRRATAHFRRNRFAAARADCLALLAIEPAHADATELLADVERKLGIAGARPSPPAEPPAAPTRPAVVSAPPPPPAPATVPASVGNTPAQAATSGASGLPPIALPPLPRPSAVNLPAPRFASQQACNIEYWSMAGAPWGGAKASSSPPTAADNAFTDAEYRALVSRVQAAIAQLYAPMTATQQTRFEALWAPFHDYPNAADQRYFAAFLPLMDEYLRLRAAIAAVDVAQQDALLAASVAAALGDEAGVRDALDLGFMQVQQAREHEMALYGVQRQMRDLGDAPNPLAERCAARRRHQQARAALQPANGVYVLSETWHALAPASRDPERTEVTVRGDRAVTASSARIEMRTPQVESGAARAPDPVAVEIGRVSVAIDWDVPPMFALDEAISGEIRIRDAGSRGDLERRGYIVVAYKLLRDDACVPALVNFREDPSTNTERYGAVCQNRLGVYGDGIEIRQRNGTHALRNAAALAAPEGPLRAASVAGRPPQPSLLIVVDIDSTARFFYRYRLRDASEATALANPEQLGQAGSQREPAPDPQAAIAEAIAQRRALVDALGQLEASWQRELDAVRAGVANRPATAAETEQIAQLEQRVLQQQANRQAELDAIATLQTGVIVRTPSAWDRRETERFRQRIIDESAQLTRLLHVAAALPRLARMASDGGRLHAATLQQMREALAQPDPMPAMQRIGASVRAHFEGEQAVALAEKERADWRYTIPAWTRTGADAAMFLGAMLGGGGAMLVGSYGVGTGYFDGGARQAAENGVRSASQVVDVVWGAWQGYFARDPATGQWRGWAGAAESTATMFVMNVVTGRVAAHLHGGKLPADVPIPQPRAGAKPRQGPEFAAFKTGEQRLADDLAALERQHAGKPANDPQRIAAQAEIERRHKIVLQRQRYDAARAEATRRHEATIPPEARRADGSVDTNHPGYRKARAAWEQELQQIAAQHNADYQQRIAEHADALEAAGAHNAAAELRAQIAGQAPRKRAQSNAELDMSGGLPQSIKSDIDLTEYAPGSARRFADAMRKRGHHVEEYADRYVITDTDTTVWKLPPAVQDMPGSGAWMARVHLDTFAGSDKFPTPGGVHYTTGGAAGVADPKGAVISNLKKGTEAGLGRTDHVDLHVIGKSTVKIVEVANSSTDGAPLSAPALLAKATGMRKHQLPEQAGVVTFGASPAAKSREQAAFLQESRKLVTQAYLRAAKKSAQLNAQRQLQLAQALAAGDRATAARLRYELQISRGANEAALDNLGQQDPQLIAQILRAEAAASSGELGQLAGDPPSSAPGVGWLWSRAWRGDGHQPPALPATPLPPIPALDALGRRCGQASAKLTEQLKVMPPQGAEAKHLAQLQQLLAAGAGDPAGAIASVRRHTGYELATVLQQWGL